jgi:hypothetical protein
MKEEPKKYIHEARVHHKQIDGEFTRTGSVTVGECDKLFKQVYEYAIKAPIAERFTGIPNSYQSHSLGALCKSYGLWPLLGPELQCVITEMDPFYPGYPGNTAYTTLLSSSSAAEWSHRIAMGKELIEFVEEVIDDPSLFSKLTFSLKR